MSTFIYGFPPSVDDAPLLKTAELDRLVGGNSGNLAFCYALWRQLGGVPAKMWMEERSSLFSHENTGVMALANQLGAHVDMGFFATALLRHQVKLVGVGLGAQADAKGAVNLPQGTQDWLKVVRDRAPTSHPNVGLRGAFTQGVLAKYGLADNTQVLGCPTLFISPDRSLGRTIEARWAGDLSSIAVTAGHPKWTGLARLEESLCSLLDGGGDYIVQSPDTMLEFGRGKYSTLQADVLEEIRRYCRPNLSASDFELWRVRHAVTFFSAPAWMEHLKRFDFVIGTRIHGVMLALQMGVPGICIAHDSRTKELCETMMVPSIEANKVINGITRSEILSLTKFDGRAFDENRLMLADRYRGFMQKNGVGLVGLNLLTSG